jgi:hypothetical protein
LADRVAAPQSIVAAPAEPARIERGRAALFEMIDACLDRLEQGLARQGVAKSGG